MAEYLIDVKSRYYYFRRIPKRHRAILGREFWKIGLNTGDRDIARDKARAMAAQHDSEIRYLDSKPPAEFIREQVEVMEQAAREAANKVELELYRAHLNGGTRSESEDWSLWQQRQDAKAARKAISAKKATMLREAKKADTARARKVEQLYNKVKQTEDAITLQKAAIQQERDSLGDLSDIERELAEDHLAGEELTLHRREQRLTKDRAELQQLGLLKKAKGRTTDPRVTIKSAFEDWIKDQDQKHDTSRKWRVYIERFIDVHGDLVLAEITPDHVRAYIRKIASLPDCRGLKIDRVPELLAYKAKHPDKQLVSPSTVAKHLDGLKALFRWAVSQGLVDSNPASSFRPPKDNRPVSSERRPFTTAELKKVLDAAKREWRDKGGEYGTDRWWILQLGIYSGARLEEICQLSKENVYQDGDTWVMRIDDDDERQVKNKTSNRTVPLHKKLVDAGFPAFVGKAKGPRIFDLEKTVGRYGNRVSKSFARLVRDQNKASIPDPKKNLVFHSIRHSFTDACRHAGVPLDICQVLLGHSAGTITSNYGAGHDVSTLKSWIDKVDPLK